MTPMTIYPAIDLRAGQVVRLAQGDPGRQTTYDQNPTAVAQRWVDGGATWLHVVNLDGALGDSDNRNQQALRAIQMAVGHRAAVQFGGGLRELADVRDAFELGVDRVVLGTAAVQDPEMVTTALQKYGPDRIAVGIDARRGRVRVRGWTEEADVTPMALAQRLARIGLRTIIYTDIARDGVGTGVNIAGTRELAEATGLDLIASGGVASLLDIRQVLEAGLAGLIVGRALYDGRVDLGQALALTRGKGG